MRRSTATTEYLKECMGTALLELMKEKPMEKISIEEMTAKADVGRSTYFRYFKTKDEVLVFKILCLWNRFSEKRLDVYLKTLVSGKQEEDIITYYKRNGTAYALYGIVNAWILRGYKESPEQMVETLGKNQLH